MCGIVGLFLKDEALSPELGTLVAGMLGVLSDRGPDSAGIAVYGAGTPGMVKLTLRVAPPHDPDGVTAAVAAATGGPVAASLHADHLVLSLPEAALPAARAAVQPLAPGVGIVGTGSRMELYKAVGLPTEVTRRFGIEQMAGTHAIGHTRMATESAVTTKGAHPFSTGPDQCLVHNGSLSNHNDLRRRLVREGLSFETDNDTEVAAGFLSWRMREGDTLGVALEAGLAELDGFYTFVVGTESGFGVLRDPIACKPAVMAETDRWVAFGSEYRALVDLPGITQARVWEPEPATVYFWERAA